jgi:hypothetical protein
MTSSEPEVMVLPPYSVVWSWVLDVRSESWAMVERFFKTCVSSRPCLSVSITLKLMNERPITVVARPKAWTVFALSSPRIFGSNPTQGTDISVLCALILCVVRPPTLWSSGQSSWLQIQRSRVWFAALTDFSEKYWIWNGVHSASCV